MFYRNIRLGFEGKNNRSVLWNNREINIMTSLDRNFDIQKACNRSFKLSEWKIQ